MGRGEKGRWEKGEEGKGEEGEKRRGGRKEDEEEWEIETECLKGNVHLQETSFLIAGGRLRLLPPDICLMCGDIDHVSLVL